jgi:hypothetical protein
MAPYIWLVLPSLFVTAGLAVVACLEIAGGHPLTVGAPRNMAEAVAMRDGASVVRQLARGGDPNEIELIRSGVLLDRVVLATPLETAVIVDAGSIFDVLAAGERNPQNARLTCLAADVGARAVASRLGDASMCRAGAALEVVLSRP